MYALCKRVAVEQDSYQKQKEVNYLRLVEPLSGISYTY
jgi:hypothetical protein